MLHVLHSSVCVSSGFRRFLPSALSGDTLPHPARQVKAAGLFAGGKPAAVRARLIREGIHARKETIP